MIVSPWNMAMVLFLHSVFSQSSITGDPGKQCPSDSILTPEGECKCALEDCPTCERGLIKTVLRKGLKLPGDCCDHFTCAPSPDCEKVQCPEIPSCPTDSYRLPAVTSQNECCPSSQGCQCLPTCETFSCPNNSSPVIVAEGNNRLPGKCCPVYSCVELGAEVVNPDEPAQDSRDCLSDNLYKHGMNWTTPDFCTTCTCKNGQAICHALACIPCQKPIQVPGECCPRCMEVQPPHCPQLSNCTERCPNGNLEDENGCVSCQCRKGCPKDCFTEIDSKGEQICRCDTRKPATCPSISNCNKKCDFGYQKDEFNCDLCECEKCNKKCAHGYLKNEKGVLMCKCQPWSLRESIPLKIEESRVCRTEGEVIRDSGETWFDGCRQCSCIDGTEMCSLIHCSPFTCSKPIVNATLNCCPFCPDDPATNKEISHMVCSTPNGEIMLEGETSKLDDCTTCICHEGLALCRGEECPPTLCSNPKPPGPKECCPTCPSVEDDEDTLNSLRTDYDVECSSPSANNTSWRESSCLSCRCIDNKKYCYTELCDSISKCKRSLTIKGRCCPICIDKADKYKLEGMCIHLNSSHDNGEEWSVDMCTRCKCIAGRTECTKKMCPSSCSHTSENLDRCCLSCDVSSDYHSMPELFYIVVLLLVVCASIALVVCLTRHLRSKKQQIRLDLSCYPPLKQYTYIPTSPYDNKGSQKIILAEKASLAPV